MRRTVSSAWHLKKGKQVQQDGGEKQNRTKCANLVKKLAVTLSCVQIDVSFLLYEHYFHNISIKTDLI